MSETESMQDWVQVLQYTCFAAERGPCNEARLAAALAELSSLRSSSVGGVVYGSVGRSYKYIQDGQSLSASALQSGGGRSRGMKRCTPLRQFSNHVRKRMSAKRLAMTASLCPQHHLLRCAE